MEGAPKNPENKEQIIENIVFEHKVKRGGISEYRSSASDRKIMILSSTSVRPKPETPYNVRVVEDTEPEKPLEGKLIVEIIPSQEDVEEAEGIRQDFEKNEVRIGNEKTPILEGSEEVLKWKIEGEQFREEGETVVETYFKRSDGIELRPGVPFHGKTHFEDRDRFLSLTEYRTLKKEYPEYLKAVEDSESEDEVQGAEAKKYLEELGKKHPESRWVLNALRHLNNLASEPAKDILERDPYFVETPHVVETMEAFTKLVNRQRERKQGVVILEGDAGTGKNKVVDHFAFLTQRPLFRFTCSAGKDEQDLKYLLEYDAQKGTYRIKSSVVEALETPGAILEFDEINTLKPEVAKSLNSLFDHDRAIYLGEDKASVKASEEVVLVGLQNPQHYMGVKPLAETIKSRARIMEVTYPPLTAENGSTRPDEAMILRQYVPELKDLDQKEFLLLWEAVVNNQQSREASDLISIDTKEKIEDVLEIVKIANGVRAAYRDFHEGKSDEPLKFVFSLRESVESAYELEQTEPSEVEKSSGMTKAKKAILAVVLPKAPMGQERQYLETLILEL